MGGFFFSPDIKETRRGWTRKKWEGQVDETGGDKRVWGGWMPRRRMRGQGPPRSFGANNSMNGRSPGSYLSQSLSFMSQKCKLQSGNENRRDWSPCISFSASLWQQEQLLRQVLFGCFLHRHWLVTTLDASLCRPSSNLHRRLWEFLAQKKAFSNLFVWKRSEKSLSGVMQHPCNALSCFLIAYPLSTALLFFIFPGLQSRSLQQIITLKT